MKITTKKLILSALFTALTLIFTMFVRIPLPLGYVNLGDTFVLLSTFILGPLGVLSAGLGSALADLFGYVTYAPGTLIIKTVMALSAYLIRKAILKVSKKELLAEIVAGIIGAIIMALGYFVYETLFFASAGVAILSAPWNLLQGAIGVIVSVVIMQILKATKTLDKLKN